MAFDFTRIRVGFGDLIGDLDRVQGAVEAALTLSSDLRAFLGGRLVSDVALSTSETSIEHKLDRVPRGLVVTSLDGDSTVYQSTAADSRFVYVTAGTGTPTASFWVF